MQCGCASTFALLNRRNSSLENKSFQKSETAQLVLSAAVCNVLSADLQMCVKHS